MKCIDLKGERFHRAVVVRKSSNCGRYTCWECICDCGNIFVAKTRDLRKGDTRSCGCLFNDTLKKMITKHNKKNTRLYRIWCNMKSRCSNPHVPGFKYYGGRGITVCEEWLSNFSTFYEWAMTNGYEDGLTIDRINNNGIYEPSNCRWVTMAVQNKNKRKRGV